MMKASILIALVLAVLFGIIGAIVYFVLRKTNPQQQDKTENVNITSAQEFLPFEDITNNMIILGNHHYRAVISCSSTNYQLKTAGEREQIELSFQRFLNSVNFPITFFLQTKIIDNTARLENLKKETENVVRNFPGLQSYAEQYQKDMENLSTLIGNNQQKKRYIIATYDDANALGTLSDDEKRLLAEKELRRRCDSLINALKAVGVNANILNTAELVELVYSCYYRTDYSYATTVAEKVPFSLFVAGTEDKFQHMPKSELLDLILGEAINQIKLSSIDSEPGGHMARMGLEELRTKYANYFQEFAQNGGLR